MKINKILPFAVCGAMIFSACDDDKMDWHTPEGHTPISSIDEIPLSTDEAMANYKFIKEYMSEYMPGVTIGLGLGADNYLSDENYQKVAANNFSQFVTGNAMKFGVVCNGSGKLNFSKIDEFIAKAKETNPDVKLYGHNLLWHTQQPQTYLKSLINPEQIITRDDEGSTTNYIAGGSFKDGMDGWTHANGKDKASYDIVDELTAPDGDGKVLKVDVTTAGTNYWDIQFQTKLIGLVEGNEYKVTYYAKTDGGSGIIRFSTNAQEGYDWKSCHYQGDQTLTDSWQEYSYSWTANGVETTLNIDFGKAGTGTYYFDNITVVDPNEKPAKINYISDGSFSDGTSDKPLGSWAKQWSDNRATAEIVDAGDSYDGDGKVLQVKNVTVDVSNQWKTQLSTNLIGLENGKKYVVSYAARKVDGSGTIRFSTNTNYSGEEPSWKMCHYQGDKELTDTWAQYSYEWECNGTETTLNIDCAAFEGTLQVDDVTVYEKEATSKRSLSKATTITYKLMSLEEKQTALYGAMEKWITEMINHCKPLGITEWEVLNECINDGDNKLRGVEGGWMSGDSEPVENETDGLNLNWESGTGNQHFYWGYYLGKDYAVKAFQYARAAAGDDAKLYINDYNLETSDSKLEALINYVKYIDETNGSAIVDGIGTQMHIMSFNADDSKNDAAKEGIKNMFTKLAATGKLIRISELDVAFSATHDNETKVSPSAEQLQAQSDTYKFVIEQYKAIVPASQQGGICIWTLTDADDEHEYWLKGDKPNLFNADYSRKPAYKGVCDGIAGKDLSAEFNGSDWSN